jgi:hypothetical protein
VAFLIDMPGEVTMAESAARWKAYREYLDHAAKRMPREAWEFASAEWHYDFNDPRCPHDAWVESVTILEPSSGDRHEIRGLEIRIELLGSYHDGRIRLTYPGVRHYSFYQPPRSHGRLLNRSHGDWLIDEITPSENSRPTLLLVVHEIRFDSGAVWTIEAEDVRYEWLPFEKKT